MASGQLLALGLTIDCTVIKLDNKALAMKGYNSDRATVCMATGALLDNDLGNGCLLLF